MAIQLTGNRLMVQAMAIIDIDPSLGVYRPTCKQKWVSSVQLSSEPLKDLKTYAKSLPICPGLFLVVTYCEKNRLPIYEIDFLGHPMNDWIPIKMPTAFSNKYGPLHLCYRTEELDYSEPLADINILIEQKGKHKDDRQIFTVPAGYQLINNPIHHSYLIYKRVRSNLEQTYKAILLEKYPAESKRVNLSLLPLFCFPEGIHLSKELKGFITFNLIFTLETGERIYVTCMSFREYLPEAYRAKLNLRVTEKIYYEKAICVLSRYRYTDEFAECLKHLYRLSMSKNDVPFHKVASNFVDNMALPQQIGLYGLSYSYGGSQICFSTSLSYPVISESAIYSVFKFLPVDRIINIFEAILLEKNIFFVSQSKTILGYAVEAFLSFIFPFKWEQTLIPILPLTLKEYLSSPVPLIAGISPLLVDNSIEADSLIVQMDSGATLNDEDLPPLPQKMEKQLRKRLQPLEVYDGEEVKKYLQNPEDTFIFKMQQENHPEFQSHLVREIFLQFMLTFMRNYKKFWKQPRKQSKEGKEAVLGFGEQEPHLLNNIFKVQDFLADLGMAKIGSFGCKFTEGSIFSAFIERRHRCPQDPEIVFFDDAIEKRKAKKETRFIVPVKHTKYIVVPHPEPEKIKTIFSYDRFPSILDTLHEEEIHLLLLEEGEEDDALLDYIDEQYRLQNHFYEQSEAPEELDHKIESLLLNTYKKDYAILRNTSEKSLLNRSSLSSNHSSRKGRNRSQEFRFFRNVYDRQLHEIQQIFQTWPRQLQSVASLGRFIAVTKKDYYVNLTRKLEQNLEQKIIGVYEDSPWTAQLVDYHVLIKGNCKILILDSRRSVINSDNLRVSRKKIDLEVYIPNYKIRSFINSIIPIQPAEVFASMIENSQNGMEGCWTIQNVFSLRQRVLAASKTTVQ